MSVVEHINKLNYNAIALLQQEGRTCDAVALYMEILARLSSNLYQQQENERDNNNNNEQQQQLPFQLVSVDASSSAPPYSNDLEQHFLLEGIFNRAFCILLSDANVSNYTTTTASNIIDTCDNFVTTTSIAALFNMALSLHRLGLETGKARFLDKALQLYAKVIATATQQQQQSNGNNNTTFALVLLASHLNTTHIYMECHHDAYMAKQSQTSFCELVEYYNRLVVTTTTSSNNSSNSNQQNDATGNANSVNGQNVPLSMNADEQRIIYHECYHIMSLINSTAGAA